MTAGQVVELIGGRYDGGHLQMPAGVPPQRLGVVEGRVDRRLYPIVSATGRVVIASGRIVGELYHRSTPPGVTPARYVVVRLPPARGRS